MDGNLGSMHGGVRRWDSTRDASPAEALVHPPGS